MNIFQAVCVGLPYAGQLCLRGKWKWSEIGLQRGAGGARGLWEAPGEATSAEVGKVLTGLITVAWHICPPLCTKAAPLPKYKPCTGCSG